LIVALAEDDFDLGRREFVIATAHCLAAGGIEHRTAST